MPSRHHGQVNRPRSATKARHEQSGPTVHVPMPAEPQYCHRPGCGYGGKQPAPPTTSTRSHDASHLRSQAKHDFRFMGAWCHEVPESHYTRRIKIDAEDHHRPQRLPPAPTPPRVPTPPRLNSPPSLLAYDAEFASSQNSRADDRVGGACYLSREAKTNRQCEQLQSCLVRVLSYLFAVASSRRWWWWW